MTKKKRKKVTEARRHQIFNPTGASTRVEALKPKRASRCTTSSASSNNTRPPSLSFRYARTPAGDTVAPTCVLVGVPSLGAKGEGSRGESSTATIGRAGPCTCSTILHSLYHRRPRKPKEGSLLCIGFLYNRVSHEKKGGRAGGERAEKATLGKHPKAVGASPRLQAVAPATSAQA